MSRRPPNPSAERAAKNQATIKSLLKLDANKTCADCKRNKHPRWASWSLGVFICIRCSGIHRGMGVHISKVKSVDLDSWTDEQMQQMLSWGNARANKYWEAKLADNHVPSEAKIENFIRTKYELKRWVMDGPLPDPATLDDEAATDDQPLSVVQQDIKRKESLSKSKNPRSNPPVDLIGDSDVGTPQPPPRASTTEPPSRVPPKSDPAPPKQTSTRDSLLGLDFLGTVEAAAPPRPASTTGTRSAQSRPDLKQSILSLYATAPRPQPQPQTSPPPSASFGGMSPPGNTTSQHQSQGSFGGLNNAFSSLSFGGSAAPARSPQPSNDAFSGLGSFSSAPQSSQSPKPAASAFSGLSGGSFFDTKQAAAAAPQAKTPGTGSSFGGFGAFASPKPAPPAQTSSNALGDLFDFSSPAPATTSAPASAALSSMPSLPPNTTANSVFNLSAKPATPALATATAAAAMGSFSSASLSNADVWGSGDAWIATAAPKMSSAPAPAAAGATMSTATTTTTTTLTATANDFGWGGSIMGGGGGGVSSSSSLANKPIVVGSSGKPKVATDEEFGGWASSTDAPTIGASSTRTAAPGGGNGGTPASKPAGFGGSDDLFSNVWQ